MILTVFPQVKPELRVIRASGNPLRPPGYRTTTAADRAKYVRKLRIGLQAQAPGGARTLAVSEQEAMSDYKHRRHLP